MKSRFLILTGGLLAVLAVAQAEVVKEWNFNTPSVVEEWTPRTNAGFEYSAPVQATSIDGSTGIMKMAGPVQSAKADVQSFYLPTIALGDFGNGYVRWDKIVFRVRQIGAGGAASAAWSPDGTTALIVSDIPIPVAGTFGPGGASTSITYVQQADNWLLCTWDISGAGAAHINDIRFDFVGTPANVGKNFEVDFIQLHAVAWAPDPYLTVEESLDIATVPSWFPVNFALLTQDDHQFVAYYDEQHRMTVASRMVGEQTWQYQILPSTVGWDSHNGIKMAVDDDGYLHLSGNMHADPLIYFRSSEPWRIDTLERIPSMTGQNEQSCTYPNFMRDANNRLIFKYRDGGSGNGNDLYNVYNSSTKSWSRLLSTPLTDGQGLISAYGLGPVYNPDGWFHFVWVWRDSPDCSSNHHLSYARSKDLLQWESASGVKVALPMTLNKNALWVDPIPPGGGIINGCQKLVLDYLNRPIISYHKADSNGNMQIYATRFENGAWVQHLLTNWDKPVEFSGTGTIGFIGINISGLNRVEPGIFTIAYQHKDYGSGRIVIDEATLQPIDREITIAKEYPERVNKLQIAFPEIELQRAIDVGTPSEVGASYILRWETLPPNNDLPRVGELPEPSMLRIFKLMPDRDGDGTSDARETAAGRNPTQAGDFAFEFNAAGSFDGWNAALNITNQSVVGGSIKGTATNTNPRLTWEGFQFNATAVPSIIVKFKATAVGDFQFFWGNTVTTDFAASRRIDIAYTTKNKWQAIVVPLAGHPEWDGQTIVNLRFDPIDVSGATFEIDWVRASDGDLDDDGIPDANEGLGDSDGDGMLDIEDSATPYQAWAFSHAVSGSETDDDDQDSLPNLSEYALGGNPTNPADRGQVPTLGTRTTWLDYVHAQRSAPNSGIAYTVEVADDLVSPDWTTNGVEVIGIGPLDAEFDTVTNRVSTETKTEQFIRLLIK